jgi:hypothetical protein
MEAAFAARAASPTTKDRARDVSAACMYACSSPVSIASCAGASGPSAVYLPPALTKAELTALAADPNALKAFAESLGAAPGAPRARGSRDAHAVRASQPDRRYVCAQALLLSSTPLARRSRTSWARR